MELGPEDLALLKKYPRAIYHMRSQLERKKLMPVFGAGVSQSLGLPDWNELVDRISKHPKVNARSLDRTVPSQTSRIQSIFHLFKEQQIGQTQKGTPATASVVADRNIAVQWRQVIHECLYQNACDVEFHPYISTFISVIQGAPLTVNYNFDDYIEELLSRTRTEEESDSGYETVWEPTVQYRHSTAVVYHPNGFLPREIHRGPSPNLILLEESFADQMIDAQRGHYATLLSHFFRFTSLLVGVSLSDPTLRHLLRQSAQTNPGHIHYYVAYRRNSAEHTSEDHVSSASNFHTYNLVTLFLTANQIASLGRLLSARKDQFDLAIEELELPNAYTFYLSGAVGAGKTTALSYFKSLSSFDEWLDRKHPLLHRSADDLTRSEREEVDAWIDRQFRRRNFLVGKSAQSINVVDSVASGCQKPTTER